MWYFGTLDIRINCSKNLICWIKRKLKLKNGFTHCNLIFFSFLGVPIIGHENCIFSNSLAPVPTIEFSILIVIPMIGTFFLSLSFRVLSFLLCPKLGKVLAAKSEKNVYEVDRGQAEQNLTVMFSFSAAGDRLRL